MLNEEWANRSFQNTQIFSQQLQDSQQLNDSLRSEINQLCDHLYKVEWLRDHLDIELNFEQHIAGIIFWVIFLGHWLQHLLDLSHRIASTILLLIVFVGRSNPLSIIPKVVHALHGLLMVLVPQTVMMRRRISSLQSLHIAVTIPPWQLQPINHNNTNMSHLHPVLLPWQVLLLWLCWAPHFHPSLLLRYNWHLACPPDFNCLQSYLIPTIYSLCISQCQLLSIYQLYIVFTSIYSHSKWL